ncbi:hypothetical protein LMTR13_23830 [Bradyrhizobium icense]|uniref:Uncharacterized protein n=1 Tax=Bradyrhizobium icense TaxID=1274631 RepID=A0A1B1UJB2_9BRAD|nr:hypothetical protein LMTR13_23830 [Bradyrhizobium icense]
MIPSRGSTSTALACKLRAACFFGDDRRFGKRSRKTRTDDLVGFKVRDCHWRTIVLLSRGADIHDRIAGAHRDEAKKPRKPVELIQSRFSSLSD